MCTEAGRQQADSIIVSFFSADSPTGMFKQLPSARPEKLGCSPAVGRLFAGARLSWWLGRDVVESQLLGRGVRRGNSTRNHALLSRCLLSATTRDDFAASQGPTWRCAAAKDGV